MAQRVALITGASAGIGAAFARSLAEQGHDLVLTARRADRLEARAATLKASHGIRVLIVPADLFRPGAASRIHEAALAAGMAPDILINNAGYGISDAFSDRPWTDHGAFIQVMVTAVCEMTHAALPHMVAQGFGRIVNVASVAGLLPGSRGHTLYGASKAFLIRFSEALALETEGRNIHVQALCPGFTYSEFHDVIGARAEVSTYPSYMWMTAEDLVARSLRAVEVGEPVLLVPGRFNGLVTTLAKILPHGALMALSRNRARRSEAYKAARKGEA
ncbi:MAG: SDR family NAD(P)-dependent oxidoreductase [Alphaproteobacteria bacterium]